MGGRNSVFNNPGMLFGGAPQSDQGPQVEAFSKRLNPLRQSVESDVYITPEERQSFLQQLEEAQTGLGHLANPNNKSQFSWAIDSGTIDQKLSDVEKKFSEAVAKGKENKQRATDLRSQLTAQPGRTILTAQT